MSSPLDGQHAVVTGAGRGIGAAIAKALAARGAKVSLIGRNTARLAAVAAELGSTDSSTASADVTDAAALRSAFDRLRERQGPVTILVNNAGSARSSPFLAADDTLWREMLDVNLSGVYHGIRFALPDMLQVGHGRIVNVASTAGLIGYPYVAAYCAAKHGVIGLTRSLALELARKNITVNAVCPGYTDTDLVHEAIENIRVKTGRDMQQATEVLVARNPQGRLIRPEEVAQTVVWLCLPETSSINGQSVAIAGGEVM
jgi:NAD(P)-dependent dehydrogenase (short-subunit alcohol dehydrogenase family)